MGEDNKEEEQKDAGKESKKEQYQNKEEEEPQEIVLKVDMHCEACARKVARALKRFEGVEEVKADSKTSKVVVKGKAADPIKVSERLQKKSGKKVVLISPLPKPSADDKKQETQQEDKKEEKEEPASAITVVLNVRMHCEACTRVMQKRIRKMKGVESVETDLGKDQVIVKGIVDPNCLVDHVYKATRKQVSIVKDEGNKEEKKEEAKKEVKEGHKKIEQGEAKGEDDKMTDIKRSEYWPPIHSPEYAYPNPQFFSDENPNACSVM